MIDKNKKYKTKFYELRRILALDRITTNDEKIIATFIDSCGNEKTAHFREDELEEVKPERWVNVYWLSDEKRYSHRHTYDSREEAIENRIQHEPLHYVGTRKLGDDE